MQDVVFGLRRSTRGCSWFTIVGLAGVVMTSSCQAQGANLSVKANSSAPSSMGGTTTGDAPLTREQGAAILEEMRRIEILLATKATAASQEAKAKPDMEKSVRVQLGTDEHTLGHSDAPVMIIEFSDLQCPFCRKFHLTAFQDIKREYIETGKVQYITLDLPLPIHSYAQTAAEAVRCAGQQQQYWQFRERVLGSVQPPSEDTLLSVANSIHLDVLAFRTCLKNRTFEKAIKENEDMADKIGISGTPAFVIGRMKDGWVTGVQFQGNRPFEVFKGAIDGALASNVAASMPANKANVH